MTALKTDLATWLMLFTAEICQVVLSNLSAILLLCTRSRSLSGVSEQSCRFSCLLSKTISKVKNIDTIYNLAFFLKQ